MKDKHNTLIGVIGGIALILAGGASISYAQAVPDFGGRWNTVTSKGKKMVLTLQTLRRTDVTGTYPVNGLTASTQPADRSFNTVAFVNVTLTSAELGVQSLSTISGSVTGNVLRFKWSEDGGRGAGRFIISADGRSFQGTFSRTDNPDDASGGTWNGTRATSFNGVWQTKAGEQFLYPQLLLQQSGDAVTGHLVAGRPDLGVIKEGVVEGKTLRFTIWRPISILPGRAVPEQYLGKGELVMDADGKSFRGTIIGASVIGSRIGR